MNLYLSFLCVIKLKINTEKGMIQCLIPKTDSNFFLYLNEGYRFPTMSASKISSVHTTLAYAYLVCTSTEVRGIKFPKDHFWLNLIFVKIGVGTFALGCVLFGALQVQGRAIS